MMNDTMRNKVVWEMSLGAAGLVLFCLFGCHPVKVSSACEAQIHACMAKCSPEAGFDKKIEVQRGGRNHNQQSSCEQNCRTCRDSPSAAGSNAPSGAGDPMKAEGYTPSNELLSQPLSPETPIESTAPEVPEAPEAVQ